MFALRMAARPAFGLISCCILLTLGFVSAHASTWTVDNIGDDAAKSQCTAAADDCSLRGALTKNASHGDTITFDTTVFSSPQVIQLTNGSLGLFGTYTLIGPGASMLTVQQTTAAAVFRPTGITSISGITITGGNVTGPGGGIQASIAPTLTVTDCIITGNSSTTSGGGIALENGGNLTVSNSTISNNTAGTGGGGGISYFAGASTQVLSVTNTTISGNSGGSGPGGGLVTRNTSVQTLTNTTITNNSTSFATSNSGSGIYHSLSGAITLKNTIVAGNVNNATFADIGGNCTTCFTSAGNNIIGNPGTTPGLVNNTNGDKVGTAASPLDPLLTPLGNYGGGTLTHGLLASPPSPALESGTSTGAPATDQRGIIRSGAVDIGAFEYNENVAGALPDGKVGVPYSAVIVPESGAFFYCYPSPFATNWTTMTITGMGPCPDEDRPSIRDMSSGRRGLSYLSAPTATISISGTPKAGQIFFSLVINGNAVIPLTIQTPAGPTAAGVTISGRVLTTDGRGLKGAYVIVTDSKGMTRRSMTGALGFFHLDDVRAGETYVIGVSAKRYQFAPRIITVSDEMRDLDLTAVAQIR